MQKGYFTPSVFALLLWSLASQAVLATESPPSFGGDMAFYGDVVDAPCSVNIHSRHQFVILGQVRDAALSEPGEWANAAQFQIWLEDCDPTVRSTASIMFSGTPEPQDPQVFQLDQDAGTARDVGIGIFNARNNLISPNGMPLSWTPLEEGRTVLEYTAKYRATGQNVVPGKANATVDFSVLYQ